MIDRSLYVALLAAATGVTGCVSTPEERGPPWLTPTSATAHRPFPMSSRTAADPTNRYLDDPSPRRSGGSSRTFSGPLLDEASNGVRPLVLQDQAGEFCPATTSRPAASWIRAALGGRFPLGSSWTRRRAHPRF